MTEVEKYHGIYSTPESYPNYGHSNHGAQAVSLVDKWKPDSLLDVGCGWNEFVRGLTGIKATGVDFACPGADVNADATKLPFADKVFDTLTAFDMLEHVSPDEVDKVLSEFARVSKRFILSISYVPSVNKWQGQNLHPTVRAEDWWMIRLMRAGALGLRKHGKYIVGRWEPSLRMSGSVIVVGNGPSVLKANHGAKIDAHDEVVRFNEFQTDGFERHTGTRTTLWVRLFRGKTETPGCQRVLCKHEHDANAPNCAEPFRISAMFYNRAQDLIRRRIEWGSGFTQDTRIVMPTSGLLAVAWLLEVVGVPKLTLTGFDCFQKDKTWQHEYFSPKRYTKPREHDGDMEVKMLKELEQAGRIVYL